MKIEEQVCSICGYPKSHHSPNLDNCPSGEQNRSWPYIEKEDTSYEN